jgi:hypothetical protein
MRLNKIVFTFGDYFDISVCNKALRSFIVLGTFINGQTYTVQSSADSTIYMQTDELVKDHICGHTITRLFQTFHQNDDDVRDLLYPYLVGQIGTQRRSKLLLIGGECYVYGVLFRPYFDEICIYTDMPSIAIDARRNCPDAVVELVDYDALAQMRLTCAACIINVGKRGIVDRLHIECKDSIFYVSCKQETFKRYQIVDTFQLSKKVYVLHLGTFLNA